MNLSTLRRIFLTTFLAIAAMAPAAARATDYTDIWWAGQAEDGWGVNFVQNENIIFATFYIYDVNKQPIWYSSAMASTGSGSYVGTLYQTSGSFFGGTWNPSDHPPATPVGSSTFTPSTATTGTLNYTVSSGPNRGTASKQIVRLAFQTILLGGNYSGALSSTFSNCANTADNGKFYYVVDPQVTQTTDGGLQITMTLGSGGETCTLAGVALQEGQLFRVPSATYSCTSSGNTTATLYEVKATSLGIEGRWFAPSILGCREDASFSALLR